MTDIANASLAALATSLNDGASATFTPADTVAVLEAMEAAASDMGKAIGVAENAVADSAKAWGCNFLNLAKVHGIDGDSLAERCRTRLGWKDLKGEAGTKVKQRFNTWRSNIGVLSGRWDEVDATAKAELLGGTRSFITVYKSLIEGDKAAKKAKEAEAAAAAKALELLAEQAPKPDVQPEVVSFNVTDAIETLTLSFDDMGRDDMAAISDAFNAMVAAYDARLVALTDTAPVAIAA